MYLLIKKKIMCTFKVLEQTQRRDQSLHFTTQAHTDYFTSEWHKHMESEVHIVALAWSGNCSCGSNGKDIHAQFKTCGRFVLLVAGLLRPCWTVVGDLHGAGHRVAVNPAVELYDRGLGGRWGVLRRRAFTVKQDQETSVELRRRWRDNVGFHKEQENSLFRVWLGRNHALVHFHVLRANR